jgi:hypothetical protein
MSKDNLISQQKQRKSCNTTNAFHLAFYKAYDYLSEFGEKKELIHAIIERTGPLVKASTIRTYLNDINRIPPKTRVWYLRLITPILQRLVLQKIQKERAALDEKEAVLASLPELLENELQNNK